LFRDAAHRTLDRMTEKTQVLGRVVQYDEPVWEPLELAVGEDLASAFMWMFEVETTDHRRFQAYKHIDTRQYLNIDDRGGAFDYAGVKNGRDRYDVVPLAEAIECALASWERLGATPDELADARAVIAHARERGSP
jgi:hypothetical protein